MSELLVISLGVVGLGVTYFILHLMFYLADRDDFLAFPVGILYIISGCISGAAVAVGIVKLVSRLFI